jgi:hypothetical protein
MTELQPKCPCPQSLTDELVLEAYTENKYFTDKHCYKPDSWAERDGISRTIRKKNSIGGYAQNIFFSI